MVNSARWSVFVGWQGEDSELAEDDVNEESEDKVDGEVSSSNQLQVPNEDGAANWSRKQSCHM